MHLQSATAELGQTEAHQNNYKISRMQNSFKIEPVLFVRFIMSETVSANPKLC